MWVNRVDISCFMYMMDPSQFHIHWFRSALDFETMVQKQEKFCFMNDLQSNFGGLIPRNSSVVSLKEIWFSSFWKNGSKLDILDFSHYAVLTTLLVKIILVSNTDFFRRLGKIGQYLVSILGKSQYIWKWPNSSFRYAYFLIIEYLITWFCWNCILIFIELFLFRLPKCYSMFHFVSS